MTEKANANLSGAPSSGRLSDKVREPVELAAPLSMPRPALVAMLVIGALYILANYWQFPVLASSWLHDSNWSHGFLIPLFSGYLLYTRRRELLTARRSTCLWGLPILILAVLVQVAAYYPLQIVWFSQLGMIGVLFGLVLYLAGRKIIRLTWLPILFLVLAVPVPKRVYERIAVPLQELAARGSAAILTVFGATISVTHSHLKILSISHQWRAVTVAEACSGVRSLMAFVALGIAMAYLTDRPLWQRVILVAATIPVAIFCNVVRVTITCTMFYIDQPQWGQDFMHEFMGIVMLIPAGAILWLLSWLLRSLFVEAGEEETPGDDPTASAQGAKR